MNKKNLFIIGAVIIGLGIGVGIGFNQITTAEKVGAEIEKSAPEEQITEMNGKEIAIEKIKVFMGDKNLKINYVGLNPNPYAPEGEHGIKMGVFRDEYTDNAGMEYWVNSETKEIIQIGIAPAYGNKDPEKDQKVKTIDLTPKYNKAELEKMAVEVLQDKVKDFGKITKDATYTMKDKSGLVYFFRWTKDNDFLQIGLARSGEFIGLVNTFNR